MPREIILVAGASLLGQRPPDRRVKVAGTLRRMVPGSEAGQRAGINRLDFFDQL